MNKDNAKDYLPLVQALAEGKKLQARDFDNGWSDINECSFMGEASDYRIKPEPRKAWVWWPPKDHPSFLAPGLTIHKDRAENWLREYGGHITEVTE